MSSDQEIPPTAEEAAMTQALASDRPTIDAAIKSYISLVCARNLTASATDTTTATTTNAVTGGGGGGSPSTTILGIVKENPTTTTTTSVQQRVLAFARILLGSVNTYNFPIHQTVASTMAARPGTTPKQQERLLELSIVARIWNGLIQSQQKPSKYLGRRALKRAWKGMELQSKLQKENDEDQLQWLHEFERLLFQDDKSDHDDNYDDDSALIWSADGGKAELAKRQTRRRQAAALRSKSSNNSSTVEEESSSSSSVPRIEEIKDES